MTGAKFGIFDYSYSAIMRFLLDILAALKVRRFLNLTI
ncbi:hypothetical protein N44_04739 [Microcystis aeruginosa NIES-44]|uniref:Uncharacterized protein n=1 Tax=Microcystis aeruginosa NIES-44 TaxID=449439 RepID=A0A0A1W2C9_MICAE|nr:hypothetical protein N44_04739 [Microcystis aeruginosa NIES-44]